jgi:hypothetical protein
MDDEQQNALNAYTQCVEAVRHARQQIPQMWDSSDPAYVALAASLPSVPEMEALAEQVRDRWQAMADRLSQPEVVRPVRGGSRGFLAWLLGRDR